MRRLARRLGPVAVLAGVVTIVAALAVSRPEGGGAGSRPAAALDAEQLPAPPNVRSPRAKRAARTDPRARRVAPPVRIDIAAIGVRAPLVRLGLTRDRALEVPTDFDEAGWWSGGSRPGEAGPAVIAGHVDSYTGPAVFFKLRELRRGDVIVVARRDGRRSRFAVESTEQYAKARFPTARVYGRTAHPTLRLITCGGDFDRAGGHYVDNTVVFARALSGRA